MQEKIVREKQFQAGVHGAELTTSAPVVEKQSVNPDVPLFGNPEDYSHLSEKERQDMTDKMMIQHRGWSNDPFSVNKKTQGL